MSTWTTINCDWCDYSWDEGDQCFTEDIYVSGNYYEHICENCMDADISYCEQCDNYRENQFMGSYCEDIDIWPCEDCVEEAHNNHPEWIGYCDYCGHESEDYDPSQKVGAWAGIIG